MHRIPPYNYIVNGDMSAASILGDIIDCRRIRRVSLTLKWPSTSTPVGKFEVYGSDDPLGEHDKHSNAGGSAAAASKRADYTLLTLPSGAAHGTDITINSTNVTTVGAGGSCEINLENPPAFIYVLYTRTSGGAANALKGTASGNS